jgi:2-succinyl-5-enolpyruvyl-6-hydroxy-3-cyclohexene-1-carboxylate synthase
VGAAHGSDEPVLLIVGDLSFFYDSNGLWNNYLKPNFRIILINNSGGGIFRFIAGPSETEELEEFFEAKQTMNAQGIAKTFGLNYIACNNETTFKEALKNFFEPSEKPMILEVFTPNVENGIVLKGYFKCLKERSNF